MTSRLDQHFAIPIACNEAHCPTWCLIELQGELEVQEEITSATFPVGSLCQSSFVSCTAVQGPVLLHRVVGDIHVVKFFMQKGDALQLTIGNHQLEGKKVALKKPFAMLQPEAIDTVSGLCQSYKVAQYTHHDAE